MINSLRATAQNFPDAQRDEALVHLDDLQEDINTPEKRKPQRIKIRIVALLAIASTVAGAADFSNNVLELSEKLDIPNKSRQSQPVQQLPTTLKPNQPHEPKSSN